MHPLATMFLGFTFSSTWIVKIDLYIAFPQTHKTPIHFVYLRKGARVKVSRFVYLREVKPENEVNTDFIINN